jgi:hypothetical protein
MDIGPFLKNPKNTLLRDNRVPALAAEQPLPKKMF